MKKTTFVFLWILFLSVSFAFAQGTPINDKCSNPTAISIDAYDENKNQVEATLENSTYEPIKGCPLVNVSWNPGDIWFTFVATDTRHLIYFDKNAGVRFQVLQGNCDSLWSDEFWCNELYGKTIVNTTIGQKYYIRTLAANSATDFKIGVSNLPPIATNSSCNQPLTIDVSNIKPCQVLTEGSLINADTKNNSNYANYLWYRFKAKSPYDEVSLSDVKSLTSSTFGELNCQVFEDDCSNFTQVANIYNGVFYHKKHFVKGKDYLIGVGTNKGYLYEYSLCVSNPNRKEHNDFCENAKIIEPSPSDFLEKATAADFAPAILKPTGFSGNPGKSLWFFCDAKAEEYVLTLKNPKNAVDNEFSVTVYKNSCDDLSSFNSEYLKAEDNAQIRIKNLTIGTRYLILISSENDEKANFDLYLTIPSLVLNDEKNEATKLFVNPSMMPEKSVDFDLFKASPSPSTGCVGETADLWYYFTATQEKHIFKLFDVSSNFDQHIIQLSDNQENKCIYRTRESDYFELNDLIIGQNYFIRIYQRNLDKGRIALLSPNVPVNDNFKDATFLKTHTNEACLSVGGTTLFASPDFSQQGNDVWYKFVAKSDVHTISLSNLKFIKVPDNSSQAYVNCSLLTEEDFANFKKTDNSLGTNNGYSFGFNNLIIGKVYYLRISTYNTYENAAFFDICINTPSNLSKNKDCQTALSLPLNVDNTPNILTTSTFPFISAKHSTSVESVAWFKFTATSLQHQIKVVEINNLNNFYVNRITIYKNANCNALEEINLSSNSDLRFNTEIGNTYYIAIYPSTWSITKTQFRIAVLTPPTPPQNDKCSNAIELVIQNSLPLQLVQGTLLSATNEFQSSSVDVWYQFVAKATNHRLFFKAKSVWTPNVVYTQCEQNSFVPNSIEGQDSILNIKYLIPNQRYFIKIAAWSGENTDFSIALFDSSVPNDDCSGATNINVYAENQPITPTIVDTRNATKSDVVYKNGNDFCSASSSAKDVWYQFTATSTLIEMSINGKLENVSLFRFENGKCDILEQYFCSNLYDFSNIINLGSLIAGQKYLLRLSNTQTSASISLVAKTASKAPKNDNFANAELINIVPSAYCTQAIRGTTKFATKESQRVGEKANSYLNYIDVWYKFVANDTRVKIVARDAVSGHPTQAFQFYELDNQVLKYINISSFDINQIVEKGKTYYIKIYEGVGTQPSNTSEFELCVTSPYANNQSNDLICDAITIPILAANAPTPSEKYTTDAIGVQDFEFEGCNNNWTNLPDMWFKFKATESEAVLFLNPLAGSNHPIVAIYESTSCDATFKAIYCPNSLFNSTLQLTQLIPQKEYYIRVLTNQSNPISYNIYLRKTPIKPSKAANNDCDAPQRLFVNQVFRVDSMLLSHNYLATASKSNVKPLCANTNTRTDVWFDFIATQAEHHVLIDGLYAIGNSSFAAMSVDIYENTCDALLSQKCGETWGSNQTQSIKLTTLVTGKRYLIRVHTQENTNSQGQYFNIAIVSPTAQSPNNARCDQPTKIVFSASAPYTTIDGALIGQDFNSNYFSACYSMTPTTPYVAFEFSDNTESTFIQLGNNLLGGSTDKLRILKVNPNESLKFQFASSKFMNFKVEIRPYVIKDITSCQNPKPIPLNPTMKMDNFLIDTIDTFSDSSTPTFYEFTATQSTHFIYFKHLTREYSSIYEGCKGINSGRMIELDKYNYRIDRLVPGEKVKINIQTSRAPNEYVLIAALTHSNWAKNDDCTNATTLDIADIPCSKGKTYIHNAARPELDEKVNFCKFSSSPSQTVWYDFKPKSKHTMLTINNVKRGSYKYDGSTVSLFQSDDCNNLKSIICESYNLTTGKTINVLFSDLDSTKTYKIAIGLFDSYPTDSSTYDLCLYKIAEKPYHNCQNAKVITSNGTNPITEIFKASFADALEFQPNNNACGLANRNFWLKFVATSTRETMVFKGDTIGTVAARIMSGKCDTLSYVRCAGHSNDNVITFDDLIVGKTYFIQLHTLFNPRYPGVEFYIFNPTIPNNDLCENAQTLSINTTPQLTEGNTTWANEGEYSPCAYPNTPRDIWYSFVAISGEVRVLFESEQYQKFKKVEHHIAVYKGYCGNLKDFLCASDITDSLHNGLLISGLTQGDMYRIKVLAISPQGVPNGAFKIGLLKDNRISPNTICARAINVPVSATSSVENFLDVNTKYTPLINYSQNNGNQSTLWFSFIAKAKAQKITIKDIEEEKGYKMYLETNYFANACYLSAVQIAENKTESTISGLTIGQTYHLKLLLRKNPDWSLPNNTRNVSTTFKLGICGLPELIGNDFILNAKNITVGGNQCTETLSGNTQDATNEADLGSFSSCGNNDNKEKDLWYKFKTTQKVNIKIALTNTQLVSGKNLNPYYQLFSAWNVTPGQKPNLNSEGCRSASEDKTWNLYENYTYYIRVFNNDENDSRMTFDLCVHQPLSYDEMNNALNLKVEKTENCYAFTSAIASISAKPVFPIENCSISAPSKDVWLKTYVSAATMYFNFKKAPNSANLQVALYAKKKDIIKTIPHPCLLDSISGLTIGDTLFLRIWDTNDIIGDYELCVGTGSKIIATNEIISQNNSSDILLYPNPANDNIYVKNSVFKDKPIDIEIYNLQGQLVQKIINRLTDNYLEIDISQIPSAAYILKLSDKTQYRTKVFIKN